MKFKKEYLQISEAAEYLGVHPSTLKLWEKKGILVPSRNRITQYRLYSIDDLDDFRDNIKTKETHEG